MNRSYRHEALLWRNADEFLAATVPFVHEGLEAGEGVTVALTGERTRWLKDAIGSDADGVAFVDMSELGQNPARIIPAWRRFLDEHSLLGRPVRGIGEPIWVGRRPEEIAESQLHEALMNVAVGPDTPCWAMCPYDTAQLDPAVIEEVYRSHPAVVNGAEYRGSHLYGGRAHVDLVFGTELPRLSGPSTELVFGPEGPHTISALVASTAYAAGISVDKAADLAVAVQELASNSLQRGATEASVRLVVRDDAVICDVHDGVTIGDPLTGRRSTTKGNQGGIWLAHQLCDLVQLRSTPGGTTVRVHLWR